MGKTSSWVKANKLAILALVLVLALLAKRSIDIYALYQWRSERGVGYFEQFEYDARTYNTLARSLMEGKGFCLPRSFSNHYEFELPWDKKSCLPTRVVTPLYPVFLAAVYSLFGAHSLAYSLPQLLLVLMAGVAIYMVGREIFDKRSALVAGAGVSSIFLLYDLPSVIKTEPGYLFLLPLTCWAFLRLYDEPTSSPWAIASGFLMGLTYLWRASMLSAVPFVLLWVVVVFWERKRLMVKAMLLVLFAFLLTVSPWAVRNFLLFGDFSLATSEAWGTFWNGNNPDYLGVEFFDFGERPGTSKVAREFRDRFNSNQEASIAFVKEYPSTYVLLCAKRFVAFWNPYLYTLPKARMRLYRLVAWLAVVPLGVLGMIWIREKWRKTSLPILLILAHMMTAVLVNVAYDGRFRWPVELFLALFAAYAFTHLAEAKNWQHVVA